MVDKIMSSEFIQMLNNITLGQAVIIASGVVAIFTGIKKYLSSRDEKIRTECEKANTEDNETTDMMAAITKLTTDVESLHTMVSDITKQIDDNKVDTDEKIENLKKSIDDEMREREKNSNNINRDLTAHKDSIESINKNVEKVTKQVALLIDSDKEDIKGFIVDEYHKWIKLQVIDIYSLDTLEKRYEKYLLEGGDTFVEDLMNELRGLKKVTFSEYCKNNAVVNDRNKPTES